MKKHILSFLLCAASAFCMAQVTSNPDPIPANYTGSVTLTFNPNEGNKGMVGATACYSHIGLITSKSTSLKDWKYLKNSNWGTTSQPKWTQQGDKWTLTIDNIYTYFNCPTTETVIAIVMVFHDGKGNSSKQGKAAGDNDIVVYVGDNDIWRNFEPAAVTRQARPDGIDMGIYYGADGTSVTLCTYAAANKVSRDNSEVVPAQHVFLLGDMTDWKLSNDYQLKQDGPYFWITLNNLVKGKEYRYQYVVVRSDGAKMQISDLFSEKVLHPGDQYEPRTVDPSLIGYPLLGADGGYVSVLQTNKSAYSWSDATLNFQRPDKNNLVIYELWTYDYTAKRSFEGLRARLDYLERLGVNAIELMPITEADGNINWGYSPNHYFALEKSYGTPAHFKRLVDECHQRGMAVILDMVFNHATDYNPMAKLYPYGNDQQYNPWLMEATIADSIHGDANFGAEWDHDFQPTRSMFTRVLNYWLDEYKVDGFRMDLSHGFCGRTQYDAPTNIKYYYDNAIKPHNAYFILEHWNHNNKNEYPDLINYGMLCWNNTSYAYSQLAMGYTAQDANIATANADGRVSYSESHDEERNFYKAKTWGTGGLKTNEDARMHRVPLVMAFNVLLDGSHMFYQFEELGYDYSINSKAGSTVISDANRCNPKEQPEALGWLKPTSPRMDIYNKVAAIINLRTHLLPTVFAGNPTGSSLGNGQAKRTIQWGNDVFVAGNFSAEASVSVALPSGTWYDYLNNAAPATSSYTLQPGDLKIFTGAPMTDLQETEQTSATSDRRKFMYNGRLYIRHSGRLFDIFGHRL